MCTRNLCTKLKFEVKVDSTCTLKMTQALWVAAKWNPKHFGTFERLSSTSARLTHPSKWVALSIEMHFRLHVGEEPLQKIPVMIYMINSTCKK